MASARLMFSQCGNLRLLADTKQVPDQQPSFASLLTASNASALSFCPLFPTLHHLTKYPFPSPSLYPALIIPAPLPSPASLRYPALDMALLCNATHQPAARHSLPLTPPASPNPLHSASFLPIF